MILIKLNFKFLFKFIFLFFFFLEIQSEEPKKNFEKDELIGGKRLINFLDDRGPNGLSRLNKKFSLGIGFDRLNAITALSLSYNLNQYFSIGFSHFFGNFNSYSLGSESEILNSRTGVLSAGYEATYQVSTQSFGVPKFGNAAFLQIYPFMLIDFPVFISLHYGRTETTQIINNASLFPVNILIDRKVVPYFQSTIYELPSNYYGATIGYRYIVPDRNVFVGIEFGRIYFPERNLKFYNRQGIFDKNAVSLTEYFIYDFQIKDSFKLEKVLGINYAVMVGIVF